MQVALLRELALERRQQQLGLRHRRLLRHHVRLRDLPALVLLVEDVQQPRLQIHDATRRGNLRPQRSLLDCRQRNVGGQRDVDAFALERLQLSLRLRRLHLPAHAAEHVGHVGDGELPRVQAVDLRVVRRVGDERLRRGLQARRIEVCADDREQSAFLRRGTRLCHAHGGLRGLKTRIALDTARDEIVEVRRTERLPPTARNVAACNQMLAGNDIGR